MKAQTHDIVCGELAASTSCTRVCVDKAKPKVACRLQLTKFQAEQKARLEHNFQANSQRGAVQVCPGLVFVCWLLWYKCFNAVDVLYVRDALC